MSAECKTYVAFALVTSVDFYAVIIFKKSSEGASIWIVFLHVLHGTYYAFMYISNKFKI
jgi:hypothetical protein